MAAPQSEPVDGEVTSADPRELSGSQPSAKQKRTALACFLIGLGAPVLLVAYFFISPGKRHPPAVMYLLRDHNIYALKVLGVLAAVGLVLVGLGIAALVSARRMPVAPR